jgi:hypothetical protein
MKDALLLLLFAGLGFPVGAALALFILWMDKQRRPPRRRPAAAIPGGIAIIGISINLPFAGLRGARHDWQGMVEDLIMAIFFVLASWGAWSVTRCAQLKPSDRPNYGDDI